MFCMMLRDPGNLISGVCHGDDTMYTIQFYRSLLINTTEDEQKTLDFMTNLWVSFAAKG